MSAQGCSQLGGFESNVVQVQEDWQNVEGRSHRSKGNRSSWGIVQKAMRPFNLRHHGLIWTNVTSSFCHEETALQSKKCQFVLTELVLGYAQILPNQKLQKRHFWKLEEKHYKWKRKGESAATDTKKHDIPAYRDG